MFFKNRSKEIEEEILEIRKKGIADSESVGNSANVRKTTREAKIAALESEKSVLSRRGSWKHKIIWRILIPFAIAIGATYVVSTFISGV